MKKVVVLLLLSVLVRDNAEAEGSPSPLAAVGDNVAGNTSVGSAPDSAKPNGSGKADVVGSPAAAGSDEKTQWTASLLTSNPFVPFNAVPKTTEKEKKSDDDWASKKADELNLYSVTEYPAYTEFSIEVIETKKRCWLRSDQVNNKVPFVFVNYNKEGKILSVKNTVSGEMMDIRQQEKKKDTSRGSGSSYGGYDDYGSSYYDDDFFFDFD